MIYKFIDNKGTFTVKNPHLHNAYFPLTDKNGTLLSSISPNLGGDIKRDNDHFLTPPASIEDLHSAPLCRREFFIETDNDVLRLSRPYNDTLEAGFLYHKIIKQTRLFDIEIVNFIPYNIGAEVMWIKVTNSRGKNVRIKPTTFIPLYGRSEKNLRDHRHVSSLLNRVYLNKYGICVKPTMVFDEKGHRENETLYFVSGVEDNAKPPEGQFPTLDYFYGTGDIISPDAVEKDVKPVNKKLPEFDGKESCAAFRFSERRLEKGKSANYILILGITEKPQEISKTLKALNSPLKVEKSLQETREYWFNHLSGLDFDFKNSDFNNWLLWVKLQPTLRKLFGCSFLPHFDYGKGGRGWRDLWQDALALLLTEPEQAKNMILHNFKGIRVDGSNATIITKDNGFISDRNRISRVWMDHGVWPYLTLRLYINKSGDIDILRQETTYFKDHILKRAKETDPGFYQKDYLLRAKNGKIYTGSVIEHLLIQNMVSFFNVGSHNVIRLENADWNDGLDMAADKGESVAFSFMYAHNLNDLCLFLERLKTKREKLPLLKELSLLLDSKNNPVNYNDFREKQKRLEQYLDKSRGIEGSKTEIKISELIYDLKRKSRHIFEWLNKKEWLKEGFFNGYYDNLGRQVEGIKNGKTRMMLASQVFAIMSGGTDESRIKQIWHSIDKHLYDKKLGGFRLNSDFGSIYTELGRAFGFSYGDKENGAFFSHMAVMLGFALYKQKFSKEGFRVLDSIYKMATDKKARIYPLIPEYFNNEGRGLYLYLTGSASWYIYTLVEGMLGIKFDMGNIIVEPNLLPENFYGGTIHTSFTIQGKTARLIFEKDNSRNTSLKIKSVFMGKIKIPHSDNSCVIKKEALAGSVKKEILIKVSLG